jgi:hypothetical protein
MFHGVHIHLSSTRGDEAGSSNTPPFLQENSEDLLSLSKTELVNLLTAARKSTEQAKENFAKVLKELSDHVGVKDENDSSANTAEAALNRDTPGVKETSSNHMLVLDKTIKTITLTIHEEPAEVLASLKNPTGLVKADKLQQMVLKESPPTSETIVYWR